MTVHMYTHIWECAQVTPAEPWFYSLVCMELAFQLPFFFLGIFGFALGQKWIQKPAIVRPNSFGIGAPRLILCVSFDGLNVSVCKNLPDRGKFRHRDPFFDGHAQAHARVRVCCEGGGGRGKKARACLLSGPLGGVVWGYSCGKRTLTRRRFRFRVGQHCREGRGVGGVWSWPGDVINNVACAACWRVHRCDTRTLCCRCTGSVLL